MAETVKGFGELGEKVSSRPLKFFWLLDVSGSMSMDGKITSLNEAIRTCIQPMQEVAKANPRAQMFVRAIKFGSTASWHINQDTPVDNFTWENLTASGETAMGAALELLSKEITESKMPDRCIPPVFVLVTDGQPTDNFDQGLKKLLDEPWGVKAVRIAIGIGKDANMSVLEKFCSNSKEIPPLNANNATDLVNYIRWASTVVVANVAKPQTQGGSSTPVGGSSTPPIPKPQPSGKPTPGGVW